VNGLEGCVFCKIIAGEIPCDKVYENDRILAFRDIQPQAPVHILIMPRRHMNSVLDLADLKNGLSANMIEAAAHIAGLEHIDQSGFRLLTNCGADAGQTVSHLHFHLLGGKKLTAPMA
jgi:histidine triad (HIT) family protein